MRGFASACAALVAGVVGLLMLGTPPGGAEETAGPGPYRVGVVSTLFRDVPDAMIPTLLRPIRGVIESQTGLEGSLAPVKNWEHLGQQLDSGKLHLGLFHGFEFAWARQKYPRLSPLVVTVGEKGLSQVCVLVRHDSDAKTLDDLKGASLAVPRRTREHCHVYLERHCTGCGCTPATYFQRTNRPFTVEDAMLALVQGRVHAVLTDGASVEAYRASRPAGFAKLRVLSRSENFPPAVFVHRPGLVDEAALRRFREGLLKAHDHAESKEVMTFCKIARFDNVPADYEKSLETSLKTYPALPPASPK
jgi:ABC-type phosphate/phosphonate transport system substrate-binding protein